MEALPDTFLLPQIKENSLSLRAARLLRDVIMAGQIAQGTCLRENDIAKQLGVSRAPLREAFRILEGEGLVEIQPRRGVFVVRTTPQEEHEIYEVRSLLEGYGARLAATRIDPAGIRQMRELLEQMRLAAAENRYADYQAISLQFHDTFMRFGQSKLYGLYEQTRRFVLRVQAFKPGPHSIEQNSIDEHARILDAIERRDPDEAESAARYHLGGVHRRAQSDPE